jgi:predicted regulator of Ras-like GTPase activity (Roadblock/LC7/MglB family)
MAKKRGINETLTTVEEVIISSESAPEEIANVEEISDLPNWLDTAREIRKNEDVLGYILMGELRATVDITDPEKIVEYAMLSSQGFESSEAVAESFSLGEIKSIIIEGKNVKAVCVNLGCNNKLSVFMRKDADHGNLLSAIAEQDNPS